MRRRLSGCGSLAMTSDRLTGPEEVAFWARVGDLLAQRKTMGAHGPHSLVQLALALGLSRSALAVRIHHARGLAVYGPWPSVEAVVEVLNRPALELEPVTIQEVMG